MKICHLFKITALLAVFSLGACVKEDLYNTSHPEKGAVRITTDWTGRSSDAVLPESYLLRIGESEQTVSRESNVFNALFAPGTQDLLVYHPAEGITISGNAATINTKEDGRLESAPGHLLSASGLLEVVKDDTLRVNVKMRQHTRTLALVLELNPGDEQRIAGTSATLTGIVSAIDLRDGRVTFTEGKTVVPAFVSETNNGQPVLSAVLRLFGSVTGERQMLTLTITRTDGTVQVVVTDMTDSLKDFCTGGSMEPLALSATLELPAEVGFTATIGNWTVVDNGDVKVN